MRVFAAIAVLTACSEYALDPATDPATDPGSAPGDDTEGDGTVDPDGTDGDGQQDCEAASVPGGTCVVDATCTADLGDAGAPWEVGIEWQWAGDVLTAPVIGNLTDDDGDGRIDRNDVPEVVVVSDGALVALDGATGDVRWTLDGFANTGGLAIADVNGSGTPDIVAFDTDLRPVVVSHAGQPVWTAQYAARTPFPQATVADLDADGRPEVVADTQVLDGRTGTRRFEVPVAADLPYRLPAIGDLDLDGRQELIVGDTVFDATGMALWTTPIHGTYGHWAALVNADDDLEAEVAFVGGGALGLYEHDGTEILRVAATAERPGAPCVADFDGDGAAEIAWASDSALSLHELDGTRIWSIAVDDSSGLAACGGFDFDADGAYEVVYADQRTVYVLDGLTGARRVAMHGHASATLWEYPTIADIDRDGSAELAVASNGGGGWRGVTVLGQVADAWPPSGTTWHTHDFAVTNVNPDGTVPAWPEPPWLAHNVYRARPATDAPGVDLKVAFVDVCYGGCDPDDVAELSVQVFNTGTAASRAHVPVALYAVYGDALELVEVQRVPDRVASGHSAPSLTFRLTVGDAGADGWLVRVDDSGAGGEVQVECDETDNTDLWLDTPC